MSVMRGASSARPFGRGVPLWIVSPLAVAYGLGVVALVASGELPVQQGALLLGVPVVLAVAVLRPEWMILILIVVPPSVVDSIQPRPLILVMLVTLFGLLLQGSLRIGPKSGIYPLVGIVLAAMAIQADVPGLDTIIAGSLLNTLIYYVLLMLIAFNAIANERISIHMLINALLVGLVIAVIVQPIVAESSTFSGIQTPYRGKFSYLAVMGFGVTYLRVSLAGSAGRLKSRVDMALMVMFLALTAIGFGRAAWITALWIFALGSIWIGRKALWVVGSLVVLLTLTVPIVGERIVPGGTENLTDPDRLAVVTTGRSDLWAELWERGVEALPFGQGWGYIPSLDSMEIFGVEGQFQLRSSFVHPHNDFVYLFVELGAVGLGLLVVFWLSLFRRIRSLSRSGTPVTRYGVRVLLPVIITMFTVQLFDNGFAIRAVATRFFIAAGLVFGVSYLQRDRGLVEGVDPRSLRTTRGFALPDG